MNVPVAIAMFGWIPLVLALFVYLPHRRAALIGFVAGWMFLPIASYVIHGLPDYTKMSATCGGVLLGAVIFDFRRLISLRLRLVDIPILVLCLSPFASSISNHMGVHEGLSALCDWVITWGVPYAMGRLYFDELPYLRELAIGIFLGGLLYVPLCLWEIVNGPDLHRLVYGYALHFLDQELRFGIQRPMVFMQGGLMVGAWMAAASVVGFWLWKSGSLPSRFRYWLAWLVPLLAFATIDVRSVNGWVLMLTGAGLLALHSCWRSAIPLIAIMLSITAYVSVRAAGVWSGEQAVPLVESLIDAAKGRSILFRLQNEDIIISNVHERPVLGWGRQIGSVDDHNGGLAVRDSLWVSVFAQCGTVGLVGIMGTLLLPVAVFIRRFPASQWQEAAVAPAAALAVVVILYAIDDLANGSINPVFMLASGGLAGLRCERLACCAKS